MQCGRAACSYEQSLERTVMAGAAYLCVLDCDGMHLACVDTSFAQGLGRGRVQPVVTPPGRHPANLKLVPHAVHIV